MNFVPTALIAIVGGILPPILWLWFWLREDSLHPEPKKYIRRSFGLGMLAVLFALPMEQAAFTLIVGTGMLIVAWSAIEECLKFFAAVLGGLNTKALNEPIDAVIYMITAALGFSALENALFLLSPEAAGSLASAVITTNVRFVGATLLHTIASGAIGVGMALAFYRPRVVKVLYTVGGVCIAILLHTIFNYFILNTRNESIFFIFAFVWLIAILLILFFEKIKKIRKLQAV